MNEPVKSDDNVWVWEAGWRYELLPLGIGAEQAGEFADFVELWRSKMRGNDLPLWSDFALDDLMPWWGWISVFDTVPGEDDAMDTRLWGTQLAAIGGVDYTGQRVEGVDAVPDGWANQITRTDVRHRMAVLNGPNFGYAEGPINIELRGLGRMAYFAVPLGPNAEGTRSVMAPSRVTLD